MAIFKKLNYIGVSLALAYSIAAVVLQVWRMAQWNLHYPVQILSSATVITLITYGVLQLLMLQAGPAQGLITTGFMAVASVTHFIIGSLYKDSNGYWVMAAFELVFAGVLGVLQLMKAGRTTKVLRNFVVKDSEKSQDAPRSTIKPRLPTGLTDETRMDVTAKETSELPVQKVVMPSPQIDLGNSPQPQAESSVTVGLAEMHNSLITDHNFSDNSRFAFPQRVDPEMLRAPEGLSDVDTP